MTDDLQIALARKRASRKAARLVVHSEAEQAKEAKAFVTCSVCGSKIDVQDECPVCKSKIDWGF